MLNRNKWFWNALSPNIFISTNIDYYVIKIITHSPYIINFISFFKFSRTKIFSYFLLKPFKTWLVKTYSESHSMTLSINGTTGVSNVITPTINASSKKTSSTTTPSDFACLLVNMFVKNEGRLIVSGHNTICNKTSNASNWIIVFYSFVLNDN